MYLPRFERGLSKLPIACSLYGILFLKFSKMVTDLLENFLAKKFIISMIIFAIPYLLLIIFKRLGTFLYIWHDLEYFPILAAKQVRLVQIDTVK